MLRGIDVSAYQARGNKSIDWQAVAQAGVDFAFVRASDGKRSDMRCTEYLRAMQYTPIIPGAYQLLRASEGLPVHQENLRAAIRLLREGQVAPMPIAIDFERVGSDFSDGCTAKANLQALMSMVGWLLDEMGVYPIIYTGPAFWAEFMKAAQPPTSDLETIGSCPLWLADYNDRRPGELSAPLPWGRVSFWQYTNRGVVQGVPSSYDKNGPSLDLNYYRGSMDDLRKLCWS